MKIKKSKKKKYIEDRIFEEGKARVLEVSTKQTGTSNLSKDLKYQAKAPGKRLSKFGKIYYEYRKNRTDRSATKKI
jgi:hypothetical protein